MEAVTHAAGGTMYLFVTCHIGPIGEGQDNRHSELQISLPALWSCDSGSGEFDFVSHKLS